MGFSITSKAILHEPITLLHAPIQQHVARLCKLIEIVYKGQLAEEPIEKVP